MKRKVIVDKIGHKEWINKKGKHVVWHIPEWLGVLSIVGIGLVSTFALWTFVTLFVGIASAL